MSAPRESTEPAGLRLRAVTADNLEAVLAVRVTEPQSRFVAPVAVSLAEAYVHPDVAWPRAIYLDEAVVGFVLGGFSPEPTAFWPDEPLYALWRLNIDARHQGKGVGRFAVEAVAAEAVRRGAGRLTTFYRRGADGPEGFYLRLGFRPDGRLLGDQTVAHVDLPWT